MKGPTQQGFASFFVSVFFLLVWSFVFAWIFWVGLVFLTIPGPAGECNG